MAAKAKSKPKAKPKEEPKRIHEFKLDDFKGGAIAGVLCLEAFKDPSLLEPVRKWIAEGLLEFGAGDSNVAYDMLYIVGEKSTPAIEEDEQKPSQQPIKKSKPVEARRPEAVIVSVTLPKMVRSKSWPYECGEWQRSEDKKSGKTTQNPCTGETGIRWQAGYDGRPEPPMKPEVCPRCQRELIEQGTAASGHVCDECLSVLFPAKGD